MDPNGVYLNHSTEGISQYMNTAWHVQRDTDIVHFSGQNYPFGEHIAFTDNESLISSFLQLVHRHVVPLNGRTAGILNIFALLSVYLASGFIYLIFRQLYTPVWISVWAALGITFLSPQHEHLQGELGLATPFVFPMMLWLTGLFENSLTRRYLSLTIGIVVWASTQINGFYFWGIALFLSGYTLWHWLHRPNWKRFYPRALHLVAMLLLPYVTLHLWYHWSDYAIDRPLELESFRQNRSTLVGLFLPPDFVQHRGTVPQAYLGITAGLFTLWVFFQLLRPFKRIKKDDYAHLLNEPFLLAGLFSGGLLLLMSLDLAALPGFRWLWDVSGPLRGLRRPAHLAWVYYYVANIGGVYTCWKLANQIPERLKWLGKGLMLLPLILLGVEAVFWQNWVNVRPGPNLERAAPKAIPGGAAQYQAILPMPYYHASPADTSAQPDPDFYQSVRHMGLVHGLPDMGMYQFKPSAAEMLALLQLSLAPCDFPSVLNELPNDKPLLLVFRSQNLLSVQTQAPHLVQNALPLRTDSNLTLMALMPDSIRSAVQNEQDKRLQEVRRLPFVANSTWKNRKGQPPVAHESFNSLEGGRIFQGGGAAQGRLSQPFVLWEGRLDTGMYVVSFWLYANRDQGLQHHILVQHGANPVEENHLRPFVKAIVNDWALFEIPLLATQDKAQYRLTLFRPDSNLPFELDELLIREANTDYFRAETGWIVKNNYWYRRF